MTISGIEHTFVEVNGIRMHTVQAGPADGRLTVLLHGFPECWYSFRRQIEPLVQAGYRVVVPDQRGYNLTDKTPPYDVGTLAGDIASLIAACGRQQAFVAGHDWGAAVAWTLAGLYPQVVSRLAILNVPHPQVMAHALRGRNILLILRSWYIFFFQIPRLPEWLLSRRDFTAMRRMMKTSSQPGTFSADDLAVYRDAWAQPGALSATIGWYRTLMRTALSGDPKSVVGRTQAPTLILWGEGDIALGVELAEQSLGWADQGRLVRFPNATHWVHEDLPEQISQHLVDHFNS
jgi:pimeloyl-ACP methyl ester carboxylesterase